MKHSPIYSPIRWIFLILAIAACALLTSCQSSTASLEDFTQTVYKPVYASGFEILGSENGRSTILKTAASWQGGTSSGTMLFISRGGEKAPAGFTGQVVDAGAERIICMSSTHIAMLDALGEVKRVVGVSGIDFITNEYITAGRDTIGDVGYDGGTNYELVVALDPDLVLLYGVKGASVMEAKLRELRIPFAYLGEYLEESPLGKAEWMVAVAEIIDRRDEGKTVFEPIPQRYNALKEQAAGVANRPRVMINAPYGDSWFMASTTSYVAQLIGDAGGEYVYRHNTSNASLPIDLEEAYVLAQSSDVWVNVGSFATYSDFIARVPRFADVPCVRGRALYNCDLRTNASGGNDYWESGVVHPDVVLRDLIKIFHPELVQEDLVYYRRME